ncbi:MAG: Mrp/NBP35 family ATP-binding protein, partial [Candidatus Methanomethyliaceae archaeon]|nr:Mrp/NBP35 family ATP-binding protein [Candidatus Methanomethyliaceae archaeon]
MITKDEVLESLKKVMDPELGIDIISAGMVRKISVEGDSVSVTLALTSDTCPLANKLRKGVEEAIRSLKGVGKVEVELTVMSEEELNRLVEKVKSRGRLAQLPVKLPKKGIERIIAVLSGKGGVGKSSIAAMLAVELSRQGLKVGVLDADITGPSIPKIFGVTTPPEVKKGRIIPSTSRGGIEIISMNLITGQEEAPIIWRGPLVSGAIRQFYVDVEWGKLDYLIVDLPPGTSDAQLTVMQILPVDGIVVVTSPQELAGMIVAKAVNMSQKLNVPIIGVIENMSYIRCPKCGEKVNLFGQSKGKLLAD